MTKNFETIGTYFVGSVLSFPFLMVGFLLTSSALVLIGTGIVGFLSIF